MPTKPLSGGMTLGQYEIIEQRNVGFLISVYNAYQPILKRKVIVQTLSPTWLDDPDSQASFLRGAQIIAEYEHPNIVPILDYGVQDGLAYIVMRHLNGGTLRAKLMQGNLPFGAVIRLVSQIGDVLEYVHSLGKVHGDPATNNIVFDGWGSAYLADFLMNGFQQQREGGIAGVPNYIAPERWREEAPTPATDQYALGVIAYEALVGRPPFVEESIAPLMYKHMTEVPPVPTEFRAEVPNAVNDVLLRALAKTAQERYPTVREFVREFEKALSTLPPPIFISYSRRNTDYAKALKQHLIHSGLSVWLDDEIEHGDQWFNQIHDAIKTCGAFVVLMTPDAEHSEWVQKEILLAKRYRKPIFPLLLNGDEFAILIDVQYGDVRNGAMPDSEFQRRVSRAIFANE